MTKRDERAKDNARAARAREGLAGRCSVGCGRAAHDGDCTTARERAHERCCPDCLGAEGGCPCPGHDTYRMAYGIPRPNPRPRGRRVP